MRERKSQFPDETIDFSHLSDDELRVEWRNVPQEFPETAFGEWNEFVLKIKREAGRRRIDLIK